MLSRAVKHHGQHQAARSDRTENLRREVKLASQAFSDELVDTVNGKVALMFHNQRRLEAEAKDLQTLTSRYAKQTQKWVQCVNNFNHALKEVGDLESWSRAIEADMNEVAQIITADSDYVPPAQRLPSS